MITGEKLTLRDYLAIAYTLHTHCMHIAYTLHTHWFCEFIFPSNQNYFEVHQIDAAAPLLTSPRRHLSSQIVAFWAADKADKVPMGSWQCTALMAIALKQLCASLGSCGFLGSVEVVQWCVHCRCSVALGAVGVQCTSASGCLGALLWFVHSLHRVNHSSWGRFTLNRGWLQVSD